MAVEDSGTTHPAREFSLRGIALNVSHKREGVAAVTREAIVLIETLTFLDNGSTTRKVSTASCTFLSAVGIHPGDTITLPGGQPKAVLKVVSAFAPYWHPRGFTTMGLLE